MTTHAEVIRFAAVALEATAKELGTSVGEGVAGLYEAAAELERLRGVEENLPKYEDTGHGFCPWVGVAYTWLACEKKAVCVKPYWNNQKQEWITVHGGYSGAPSDPAIEVTRLFSTREAAEQGGG